MSFDVGCVDCEFNNAQRTGFFWRAKTIHATRQSTTTQESTQKTKKPSKRIQHASPTGPIEENTVKESWAPHVQGVESVTVSFSSGRQRLSSQQQNHDICRH